MSEPQRPDTVHLDARTLRGIAHPLRVRLLGMLRADGPATATGLAARLGLSSAATSYHLRQLATYGFVVEDAGRGQPRERWWAAAHRSTTMDLRATEDPDTLAVGETYLRAISEVYHQKVQAHLDELASLPTPWRDVGTMTDIMLRLSPEQSTELFARMWDVVESYPRTDDPVADGESPDARAVVVQVQVFRRPGEVG